MAINNDKNYGRTFFDVIAEHPKLTFFSFLGLLMIAITLIITKVPFKVGTVELGSNSVLHDTVVITKIDTVFKAQPALKTPLISSTVHAEDPRNKTIVKSGETFVSVKDQPANINTGTNNGIVGNNGTINNNGIQPRKITKEDFEMFKSAFPDTTIQVNFRVYGMADAEIYHLKKQIIQLLKANGYNNIQEEFLVVIGQEPPNKITINPTTNGVIFEIPPASL